MGIVAQRAIIPVIESEGYGNLNDNEKGLVMSEFLKESRAAAREKAEEENPELFALLELQKISKREKAVLGKERIKTATERLKAMQRR